MNNEKAKPTLVRSKRYQRASNYLNHQKEYPLEEALKLLEQVSYCRFDPSVGVTIQLNLNQKKEEAPIRFNVTLPHQTGRLRRVLVFADQKVDGADFQGTEQTIADIAKGSFKPMKDFDLVLATPNWMPKLAEIAKKLGPQGLMPSPKTKTVTSDPQKALQEAQGGSVSIKQEGHTPVIHTVVGKLSLGQKALQENLQTLLEALTKQRPLKVRGVFIRKLTLSTSMSPGVIVKLDK